MTLSGTQLDCGLHWFWLEKEVEVLGIIKQKSQYSFYETVPLYVSRQQVFIEDLLFAWALWRAPKIYTIQFMNPGIEATDDPWTMQGLRVLIPAHHAIKKSCITLDSPTKWTTHGLLLTRSLTKNMKSWSTHMCMLYVFVCYTYYIPYSYNKVSEGKVNSIRKIMRKRKCIHSTVCIYWKKST